MARSKRSQEASPTQGSRKSSRLNPEEAKEEETTAPEAAVVEKSDESVEEPQEEGKPPAKEDESSTNDEEEEPSADEEDPEEEGDDKDEESVTEVVDDGAEEEVQLPDFDASIDYASNFTVKFGTVPHSPALNPLGINLHVADKVTSETHINDEGTAFRCCETGNGYALQIFGYLAKIISFAAAHDIKFESYGQIEHVVSQEFVRFNGLYPQTAKKNSNREARAFSDIFSGFNQCGTYANIPCNAELRKILYMYAKMRTGAKGWRVYTDNFGALVWAIKIYFCEHTGQKGKTVGPYIPMTIALLNGHIKHCNLKITLPEMPPMNAKVKDDGTSVPNNDAALVMFLKEANDDVITELNSIIDGYPAIELVQIEIKNWIANTLPVTHSLQSPIKSGKCKPKTVSTAKFNKNSQVWKIYAEPPAVWPEIKTGAPP